MKVSMQSNLIGILRVIFLVSSFGLGYVKKICKFNMDLVLPYFVEKILSGFVFFLVAVVAVVVLETLFSFDGRVQYPVKWE